MEIPAAFDDHFLEWFRTATEDAWARYRERSFMTWVAGGLGGSDRQQATRWLGGLSDVTIDGIERQWSFRFPPDYRRFLHRLHATDRPLTGTRFFDARELLPVVEPGFYNWLTDEAGIRGVLDGVLAGLLFDVEENDLWRESWGSRPPGRDERQRRLRALLDRAPKLIPLVGQRFLLTEPCREGNPVLSIQQSDIIVYGTDLRDYLLAEFRELLGLGEWSPTFRSDWLAIPFWGEFLAGT